MKIGYRYNEMNGIHIAAQSRINIRGQSPNIAANLGIKTKTGNCLY